VNFNFKNGEKEEVSVVRIWNWKMGYEGSWNLKRKRRFGEGEGGIWLIYIYEGYAVGCLNDAQELQLREREREIGRQMNGRKT
jgi:hypothetical protein